MGMKDRVGSAGDAGDADGPGDGSGRSADGDPSPLDVGAGLPDGDASLADGHASPGERRRTAMRAGGTARVCRTSMRAS